MKEQTIANETMPRQTRTSEITSNLRLWKEDHDLAVDIKDEVQPVFRLTLQEIIREAIHVGLPLVQKRYAAAVEAAGKVK